MRVAVSFQEIGCEIRTFDLLNILTSRSVSVHIIISNSEKLKEMMSSDLSANRVSLLLSFNNPLQSLNNINIY